jgi:hypothetical protein
MYVVRLTVGETPGQSDAVKHERLARTETWLLEIRMDPRVTASPQQLEDQYNLASQICDGMNRSYDVFEEVRPRRGPLKAVTGQAPKGALSDAITALDQEAAPNAHHHSL